MSASSAFRSHLMQQFAAAARTQSRPPLAALALRQFDRGSSSHADVVSTDDDRRHAPAAPAAVTIADDDDSVAASAAALQGLILSRRTVSNFHPLTTISPSASSDPEGRASPANADQRQRIADALTRAVQCAVSAPNHKRTEPYGFRRLLGPSPATERLADVAYHVQVRKMRRRQRSGDAAVLAEAERKRERWRGIPAFLVALVGGQGNQLLAREAVSYAVEVTGGELEATEGNDEGAYVELPFVPPSTERQLEDYAAACAAVQNALLSLHAEGIGSKWATGSVVRTPAFRSLVRCRDDELVVGLLMVGVPKRMPRPPRRRRAVDGDILQDI